MKRQIVPCVFVILLIMSAALAQTEQPTPMPGRYVHDFAGVIDEGKKSEIQAKAERLKNELATEIAVVTVRTLDGEESFDYSMRMARSWGIGSKDNEVRGLLILVAVEDRKTAFRTSRHIEGDLPDGVTGEVSRAMNAYFKNGDFGGGLSLGLDLIIGKLGSAGGQRQGSQSVAADKPSAYWLLLLLVPLPFLGLFAVRRMRQALAPRPSELIGREREISPNRAVKRGIPPKSKPSGPRQKTRKGRPKPAAMKTETPSTYRSDDSSFSSSSFGSSSSSSSDSGSSYSGGSDFGGGGSDSNW